MQADVKAVIDDVVARLVRDYQPEKIILFGSYAYGTPDEASDLDLFIIKETNVPLIDRLSGLGRVSRTA